MIPALLAGYRDGAWIDREPALGVRKAVIRAKYLRGGRNRSGMPVGRPVTLCPHGRTLTQLHDAPAGCECPRDR